MKNSARAMTLASIIAITSSAAHAEDWPRLRGPHDTGAAEANSLPSELSAANLQWRAELPGFGASSPIVVGDRVVITAYRGYGLNVEDPGPEDALLREVLCYERSSGKLLWRHTQPAAQPEASYIDFLTLHGYATNTVSSDGESIFAHLGKSGVWAFDLDGEVRWQASVGDQFHYWGSAESPLPYGDLLIVNAAIESSSVIALDKRTGHEVWRAKNMNSSWSTPVIVPGAEGDEALISVRMWLVALDAKTGVERWRFRTNQSYAAPTPIYRDGVIYASGGRPPVVMAIQAGGVGDVTETHGLWQADGVGSNITSPALYEGRLYVVDERGMVACVQASDGAILYRQRLRPDGVGFYGSPTVGDGKIYIASRQHGAYVLSAGDAFSQVSHRVFADDDSVFNATPSISGQAVFLRSNKYLYSFADPSLLKHP